MKKLYRLLLLFFLSILPGCGVLTVDVDVYKGPLANHKYIQREQLAGMAMGAKPLLIQLRDMIEWPTKNKRENMQSSENPDYNTWLMCSNEFNNEKAKQLNEILYLYAERKKPAYQYRLG